MANQLSLSAWCDKKFTNMYSHDDFVASLPQPGSRRAPPDLEKTGSASMTALHSQSHSWDHGLPEQQKSLTASGQDRHQPSTRSPPTRPTGRPSADRTAEAASGSPDVKNEDPVSAGKGASAERKHREGFKEDCQSKTSRRRAKSETVVRSLEGTLRERPVAEGGSPIGDGRNSGHEAHTSKRSYSEVSSPRKRRTRRKKWQKESQEGPRGSPRKSEAVEARPQVAGITTTNKTGSGPSEGALESSRNWSKKSSGARAESSQAEGTSLNVVKDHAKATDNQSGKIHASRQTKTSVVRSHGSASHHPTAKTKSARANRKSNNCYQCSEVAICSGEYEVESSPDSDNYRSKRRVETEGQTAVRNHSNKPKAHRATGRVQKDKGDAEQQGSCRALSQAGLDSGRRARLWGLEDADEKSVAGKKPGNIVECRSTGREDLQKTAKTSGPAKASFGGGRPRIASGEFSVESSVDSDDQASKICPIADGVKAGKESQQTSYKGESRQDSCHGREEAAVKSERKSGKASRFRSKESSEGFEGLGSTEEKRLLEDDEEGQIHRSPNFKLSASKKKSSPPSVTPSSSVRECRLDDSHKTQGSTRETESGHPTALQTQDNQIAAGNRYTKRILESVLKPKGLEKVRHKSAEATCSDAKQPGHSHRKASWPAPKVRLDHIHRAFDSNVGSASDEEVARVGKSDKQSQRSPKEYKQTDTSGIEEGQLNQDTPKIFYQTKEAIQMQWWSHDMPDAQVDREPNPSHTKSQNDRTLTACGLEPTNPSDIAPKSEAKVDGVRGAAGMSTAPEDNAGDSQSLPAQKSSLVLDWLAKQDHGSEANVKDLAPSKSDGRRQQKILEPGELSEDSFDSDETWHQFVTGIVKGSDVDVFASPHRKHRSNQIDNTASRSASAFSSAFSHGDAKPRFSPGQKNVAAVSPYCVYPSTSQPKKLSQAHTWFGPVPDVTIRDLPVTAPYHNSSPIKHSQDVKSTIAMTGGVSAFSSGQEKSSNKILKSDDRPKGLLGDKPRSRGGWEHLLDATPTFRRQAVRDIPPRFLKLAQLKAGGDDGPPVSSVPSFGSGCVYSSAGSHSGKPLSSQEPNSKHTARPILSEASLEPVVRTWSSGSISRTPGTIVPTRFSAWTNEEAASTPWKAHPSTLYSSSAEPSLPVDYPHYPASTVPYVDTHCHIDFLYQRTEFWGTFERFSRVHCFPDNYAGCLAVFCTPESFRVGAVWENLVKEKKVWAAFGCHPHHAKSYDGVVEENIIRCMKHPKAVALGEIGLDYSNRCTSDRPLQLQVFRRQLQIALQLGKPLVIHSREAEYDTLTVLRDMVPSNYKIHRHCFTGTPQEARDFFQAFPKSFIGLTALVTFPTARSVHRTACEVPLNKILLETDAPYFLPRKCPRSMRWANPSMAIFVAERIAELRRVPLDDILLAVRWNTAEMYGI